MKKLAVLLLVWLLAGCSASYTDLNQILQMKLDQQANQSIACIADNHKTLFSYYADPSVGKRSSTQTSNVFLIEGVEVVMNLDISTVLNAKYYPDQMTIKDKNHDEYIYLNGKYKDCHGNEKEYVLSVYLLENQDYYVDFQTHDVNFYASMKATELDDVVSHMMKIAKTVEVNESEVISAYSIKPADEVEREKIDLFKEQISENGRLDELIGVNDSGAYEEDEPEINDPIEDMPDVWIDELVLEE